MHPHHSQSDWIAAMDSAGRSAEGTRDLHRPIWIIKNAWLKKRSIIARPTLSVVAQPKCGRPTDTTSIKPWNLWFCHTSQTRLSGFCGGKTKLVSQPAIDVHLEHHHHQLLTSQVRICFVSTFSANFVYRKSYISWKWFWNGTNAFWWYRECLMSQTYFTTLCLHGRSFRLHLCRAFQESNGGYWEGATVKLYSIMVGYFRCLPEIVKCGAWEVGLWVVSKVGWKVCNCIYIYMGNINTFIVY